MNKGQGQGQGPVKQSGGNTTYGGKYITTTQKKQRSANRPNIASGQIKNQAELHKIMSLFQ